jgi:hypothetical protein
MPSHYDNQFGLVFPLFEHFDVGLWVPEVGGPIDPDSEAHSLIMSVYARMSKAERRRIQVRVRSAMTSQVEREGRSWADDRRDATQLSGNRRAPHSGVSENTAQPTAWSRAFTMTVPAVGMGP